MPKQAGKMHLYCTMVILILLKLLQKVIKWAICISVCFPAASGREGLPGEAMHMAAGLQFAGFCSVIATMWRICDKDASQVADYVYKYLFRNGQLDPSEAAAALNHAILHLQEDHNVTVDRWAPFVHFGI